MKRGKQSTMGHNPVCRDRVIKLLGETDEFKHEVASDKIQNVKRNALD